MIIELRLKDFALVEDVRIKFTRGFNVLTGETGAGKSIIITSLGFILGERMSTDYIRMGASSSVIEGIFQVSERSPIHRKLADWGIDIENGILHIRREIDRNARGKAFINLTPVPLSKLREIGFMLADIHGQNEHQNILDTRKHLEILDKFGRLLPLVEKVREKYKEYKSLRDKLLSMEVDEEERKRKIEFLKFAVEEIEKAGLEIGEEEALREEEKRLVNAERLYEALQLAYESLYGRDDNVYSLLQHSIQALSDIKDIDKEIDKQTGKLENMLHELDDIISSIRDVRDSLDFSSERLEEVQERLATIEMLKRKYGGSVKEILEYKQQAEEEVERLSSIDENKSEIESRLNRIEKELEELGLMLSKKRKEAARVLEKAVMNELKDLGMENTIFSVRFSYDKDDDGRYKIYPTGFDIVEFYIAPGKSEGLRPLRRIASGGEMSRIMLALKKVILEHDTPEILVFDEVDAGIGGKVAEAVGKKLKYLSRSSQVIVITHLPQIASLSDHHLYIYKEKKGDRIVSKVKALNDEERVKEIARMLAGTKITETTIQQAKELIEGSI